LRNPEVDAVVGLDAPYHGIGRVGETLTKSPYYRPERMRVPLMDLRRANNQLNVSGIDAFRYSDRYYLQVVGIEHSDFTSFPMIAMRYPTNIEGRTPEAASRGYHVVCRYVLNFLNAALKNDERGLRFINGKPEENGIPAGLVKFDLRKGLPAPPTEEEFVQIIRREGLQKAILTFREFKAKEPHQPIIRESVLTSLGYDFIGPPDPHPALAIDIFKLILEAHPTSADAYDSLAEGYVAHGDKDLAIKSYEKVLEVLPSDPTANEEKRNSLRNNALEKLKELRR
jgi:tetratricopeptide (TPR) repeat protein